MTITTIQDAIEAAAKVAEDYCRGGKKDWQGIRDATAAAIAAAIRQIAIEPAPVEPCAYLHVMHMELDQEREVVTLDEENPFGKRGINYSEEYEVTTTPLYAAPQLPAPVEAEVSDAQLLQSAAEMHAAFLRMAKSILAAIETRRNEPLAIVEDQLRIYIKDYADDHASIAALDPGGAAR